MNKQRQSNFELLRIVSMILIVLHHLGYYAPATADDPIKTGVLLLLAWGGEARCKSVHSDIWLYDSLLDFQIQIAAACGI